MRPGKTTCPVSSFNPGYRPAHAALTLATSRARGNPLASAPDCRLIAPEQQSETQKRSGHSMRITRTLAVAALLLLGALGILTGTTSLALAQAADFPNKPIHVVLPYPAGGIVDVVTRIVTEKLQAVLGQPLVVENKPGANGNLAWHQVARAAPDGYTWTFVSPALFANPRIQANVPFSEKEFVPVGGVVYTPWMVVIHTSVPAKTLPEFIDYVHA